MTQVPQVMKTLRRNGLKGQKATSLGQRPGCKEGSRFALKGQKLSCGIVAFALTGRWLRTTLTQGVALGWWLSGLSGRSGAGFSLLAKLELAILKRLVVVFIDALIFRGIGLHFEQHRT